MFKYIIELLIVVCFSYVGQVLMKKGASEIGMVELGALFVNPLSILRSILFNAKIVLGFFSAGLGAIIYLFVLSRVELTIAMPILGAMGFTVLPLIGWIFLHEPPNLGRVIGTLVIAAGMIVVALS